VDGQVYAVMNVLWVGMPVVSCDHTIRLDL
jgi:hypothetical protein